MCKIIYASDLRKGDIAQIINISGNEKTAQRLRDIGFSENTEIRCVCSGIFKDPAAYLVKGAVIALRNSDAKNIICSCDSEDK